MTEMTTTMIMQSIANWQAIRNDSTELISVLEQGNCFSYKPVVFLEPSEYIHAYPGIFEGNLLFFLIPEAYDKEEYHDDIPNYTEVCPVMWSLLGTHTIPDVVAEIRIDRWIADYKGWVPKQILKPDGIFMAFNIPSMDFESDQCLVTLGLQHSLGSPLLPTADLVVASEGTKSIIQFDDFVKPVPPFGAAAAAESFYLLQL